MNKHIALGLVNSLKIVRASENGLYLSSSDNQEVLLPNRYMISSMKIGDIIDVFIYKDSKDRLVATTKRPYAMLGEFYNFRVVDVNKIGAFVDWGLPKDLFVPKSLQKTPLKISQKVILRVSVDQKSDRLIGSTKVQQFLSSNTKELKKDQKIKLLIFAKTPMGYKVIVENLYEGMLYYNEIFEDIKIGDHKIGFIKNIRQDGKLDISLNPPKREKDEVAIKKVMQVLKEYDGVLPCDSKSDPKKIYKIFGLSKKSFKKALNELKTNGVVDV